MRIQRRAPSHENFNLIQFSQHLWDQWVLRAAGHHNKYYRSKMFMGHAGLMGKMEEKRQLGFDLKPSALEKNQYWMALATLKKYVQKAEQMHHIHHTTSRHGVYAWAGHSICQGVDIIYNRGSRTGVIRQLRTQEVIVQSSNKYILGVYYVMDVMLDAGV